MKECKKDGHPNVCSWGYVDPWKKCQPCPSNCDTCTPSEKTCTSCFFGYYFEGSTASCRPCASTGCLICDSTKCQRCDVGFVLDGSGVCQPCTTINGCSYCENECKQCETGYVLENGRCQPCANCLACTTSGCAYCNVSYTLSTSPDHCECRGCAHSPPVCHEAFPGCHNCSRTSRQCLSCPSGFTFDTNKTQCEVCTTVFPNCASCLTTESQCAECQKGHVMLATGQCERCPVFNSLTYSVQQRNLPLLDV